ncbi:hypothetical protein AVEN_104113-1 [Araneus ventricosus]|uniref:Uncharacterized protein n=1 Tax=Araneus ventricosus TaxID=182803 RepID=A0A4Y2JAY6_ARAVE|nr:hypothetical protein AVEN_104113-1 [Araneus ventricosus]
MWGPRWPSGLTATKKQIWEMYSPSDIGIDYRSVKELVNTTKECLREFRSEDFFEKLWIYVNDIYEAKSFTSPKLPRSRKVSSKIGGGSFSMSQGVKSFHRTEIAFPVVDAALNTIVERVKENELDIFQSLKDVPIHKRL